MGDNRVYGNNGWAMKETLMSGYIRLSTHKVTAPGKMLSDIGALERTIVDAKLSFIDDLNAVADWHIEEFKLTAEDFGLEVSEAERLSGIDESFRGLLKATLDTIGDDVVHYEKTENKNMFPQFPDRPSVDNLFDTYRVSQYFIVQDE
jgi:hypothetical protein